jgi:4-amino-4-deoxy-L-arabinose transferase
MSGESLRTRRAWTLPALLILSWAVLLYGNWWVGLFESSEARYAEVAREMAATGDFLSPQVDYVYHFTKPPLTYWITTMGYALFGETPFGARFFLSIAALWVLVLTAGLFRGRREAGTGVEAAAILASSLLFFFMGKVLTTDMYLTLWTTAGLFLWALLEGGRLSPRAFAWLFGLVAGAAFLTKGPVALLIWACVLVPYGLWKDRGRCLRPFADPRLWLTALVVALPWFVAVGLRHPGLLAYMAGREAAEAAVSAKRFHPGPWYYYLPVLLGGFLPWWTVLAARWRRLGDPKLRLWLLWAVVPVLVWSLFPSKLPTYILPSFPAWALLAAALLEAAPGERPARGHWIAAPLAAAGAAALLAALGLREASGGLGAVTLTLFGLSAAAGIAGAVLGAARRPRWALAGALAAMFCIQAAVPHAALDLDDRIKTAEVIGVSLRALRDPGEAILEYRVTLFSIPFYARDKVAAYDNNFLRKKFVADRPSHILQDPEHLRDYLKANPRLWVVADRDAEKTLHEDIPGLDLVLREGRHSLWASLPVVERMEKKAPAGTR